MSWKKKFKNCSIAYCSFVSRTIFTQSQRPIWSTLHKHTHTHTPNNYSKSKWFCDFEFEMQRTFNVWVSRFYYLYWLFKYRCARFCWLWFAWFFVLQTSSRFIELNQQPIKSILAKTTSLVFLPLNMTSDHPSTNNWAKFVSYHTDQRKIVSGNGVLSGTREIIFRHNFAMFNSIRLKRPSSS